MLVLVLEVLWGHVSDVYAWLMLLSLVKTSLKTQSCQLKGGQDNGAPWEETIADVWSVNSPSLFARIYDWQPSAWSCDGLYSKWFSKRAVEVRPTLKFVSHANALQCNIALLQIDSRNTAFIFGTLITKLTREYAARVRSGFARLVFLTLSLTSRVNCIIVWPRCCEHVV